MLYKSKFIPTIFTGAILISSGLANASSAVKSLQIIKSSKSGLFYSNGVMQSEVGVRYSLKDGYILKNVNFSNYDTLEPIENYKWFHVGKSGRNNYLKSINTQYSDDILVSDHLSSNVDSYYISADENYSDMKVCVSVEATNGLKIETVSTCGKNSINAFQVLSAIKPVIYDNRHFRLDRGPRFDPHDGDQYFRVDALIANERLPSMTPDLSNHTAMKLYDEESLMPNSHIFPLSDHRQGNTVNYAGAHFIDHKTVKTLSTLTPSRGRLHDYKIKYPLSSESAVANILIYQTYRDYTLLNEVLCDLSKSRENYFYCLLHNGNPNYWHPLGKGMYNNHLYDIRKVEKFNLIDVFGTKHTVQLELKHGDLYLDYYANQ
ncbi:hypothetical protein [Photobacterium minamisatsumaniensis]|uniref:hypothetical protein n=1 Tax=Photobacterium minamisatsumaniensis TaxID=2910233 RepID=UPI003D0FC725